MARNEEKHVTRLNRLLLEKEREEYLKKNPVRPRLVALKTAEDIRKWIPSLKRDLEFNLAQLEVPCYPERKINEFRSEIDRLQREFNSFVKRLKELDPESEVIPWTDRAYQARKRKASESIDIVTSATPVLTTIGEQTQPDFTKRLALPVLCGTEEALYKAEQIESNADQMYSHPNEDQPLAFDQGFIQKTKILAQRKKERQDTITASMHLNKAKTSNEVSTIAGAQIHTIRAKIDALKNTTDLLCSKDDGKSNNALHALSVDYSASDSDT